MSQEDEIMVRLYNQDTETLIGEITNQQFEFIQSHFEEEGDEDTDYALTPMMLAYLEEEGAEPGLLDLLGKALGEAEEINIRWEAD
jgi:hypothetical protein